jgi:polyferredoxin
LAVSLASAIIVTTAGSMLAAAAAAAAAAGRSIVAPILSRFLFLLIAGPRWCSIVCLEAMYDLSTFKPGVRQHLHVLSIAPFTRSQ